jgi:hypothetical protein
LDIASKPYTVRELAGKLLNGNWCVVRHEHWKRCLAVPTFDQVQQTIARAIHERGMEHT